MSKLLAGSGYAEDELSHVGKVIPASQQSAAALSLCFSACAGVLLCPFQQHFDFCELPIGSNK